jgi:hypothetical protein
MTFSRREARKLASQLLVKRDNRLLRDAGFDRADMVDPAWEFWLN